MLGWLTKLVGLLAILGVMVFDMISLGVGQFQTQDEAQQAALRAAESFAASKDLQTAYDAALTPLLAKGDMIDPAGFAVAPDGVVTLTVRHETPTLLVEKIPPLRQYADVTATVTGRPAR